MDTLRGSFDAFDDERDYDGGDDDAGREAPPVSIGTDERRMQVRAYNHWASLLEDRAFPAIDALDPGNLPDFGPYSVLLDFTAGIENPGITYLGAELAAECDISPSQLQNLDDVPARSLLSRITDHYMQILANQAPIGFEAEFVNQRGMTILYRGILLPFSSDDETIDFIYGVINWKELADQQTSDELLLQVDQALEQKPEPAPASDWADAPGAVAANDIDDDVTERELEMDDAKKIEDGLEIAGAPQGPGEDEETPFDYAARFNLNYDDEDEDEDYEDEEDEGSGLPRPSFGSLTSIGGGVRKSEPRMAVLPEVPAEERGFAEIDLEDVYADLGGASEAVFADEGEAYAADEPEGYAADEPEAYAADEPEGYAADEDDFDLTAASVEPEPASAPVEPEPAFEPEDNGAAYAAYEPEDTASGYDEAEPLELVELQPLAPEEMELGDWLAAAREMAAAARSSEDRTRTALYEAIGRAYDFSLAATAKPEDFEEIVADSGLTVQDRAPMTPVVKLVFGADYDKTRLTEYAAALSHAHRLELPRGTLGDYLRQVEGGLKGVVQAERRLRRAESGKEAAQDPREVLAAKLRAMPAIDFAEIDPSGAEFGLVMIRRGESGRVEIVGEVPEDAGLLERAAKKLVG